MPVARGIRAENPPGFDTMKGGDCFRDLSLSKVHCGAFSISPARSQEIRFQTAVNQQRELRRRLREEPAPTTRA